MIDDISDGENLSEDTLLSSLHTLLERRSGFGYLNFPDERLSSQLSELASIIASDCSSCGSLLTEASLDSDDVPHSQHSRGA